MLTELQRDAIARARAGDFDLLDAMELQHRIDTRQCAVGYLLGGRLRLLGQADHDLDCGECEGGRVDCPECEGEGDFDCETCRTRGKVVCLDCDGDGCAACADTGTVRCEECDGKGTHDCIECKACGTVACDECGGAGHLDFDCIDRGRIIVNLDGDVIHDDDHDATDPTLQARTVDAAWCRQVMAAYESGKRAAREAAEAQAEAAKPPGRQPDMQAFF